ncbi:MAG: Undecaprenyl-diphosphatase [Microgenomates group bacterium GW2011_GWC1_37_12b]|uniref:Undecaprenyl-diphosphatase n=2 Tax=Candidatus Woeseibacteriota TaxID=1752722 RepID=A0A0G0L9Z6_9BACT|nr:MAG: Undecaprenyl-diphosphatase [Microgenomates group bacterium GW2011_GWC1_37_12b]KKQ87827.1 MAG: Undecaprenyl-diphosphatase [Candidatus Woesebacteria bacterium GW2011_GWB1_38_8b]
MMEIVNSAILGIVQGLTEFLPVSSSGHLVIFQKILPGFSQPGILFDVVLHFGTLVAVVIYFRKKLVSLIFDNFWFLIIATIPAVIVGLLFDNIFEKLFASTLYVGFEFLVNAAMSYIISVVKNRGVKINLKNSFLIGIAQAIAISPGISRSGSTIFAGSVLGIDKEKVAEFSFILSLPAVMGANLLQLLKYGGSSSINYGNYMVGLVFSFVFGLLAIKLVMEFIKKGRFKFFAVYSLVLGIIVIALSL